MEKSSSKATYGKRVKEAKNEGTGKMEPVLAPEAKVDAAAITETYLSSEAQDFHAMKQENERFSAETKRQGGIIRLMIKLLKAMLPMSLFATLRTAFDSEWLEAFPKDKPFDWGDKPKPEATKVSLPSIEP